ncbi:hypothetical protein [Peterkaempfera sp. SMS 1(5)a]
MARQLVIDALTHAGPAETDRFSGLTCLRGANDDADMIAGLGTSHGTS